MADLLRSGISYFYPGDCYGTVWGKMELFDTECLKMFVSRLLSMLIVLGAIIVKVPQIIKILSSRSVESLSYVSLLSEIGAVTFTCTYNIGKGFPFNSWGESFFIAVQNLFILLLMFNYKHQRSLLALFAPIYGVGVWYLTSDLVSVELLSTLQASVIPLMVISRSTQILAVYSNGTTGQLSLITSYMNWSGTAARIFTTWQETQDPITLLMFSISFSLNTIIMIQFAIYWNSGKENPSKKQQ